ncbi:hypothetical protein PHLCEN_2v12857 [Hermanssonia centrifuga]|uniref:F-box/LRR-repeat protein 15/At3g58940/PEG3-like LRR domain-containing protein n=1 Tax=Hermanssonia centrifuga TaxID=98765 RepID=A0A2R6NG59_9APHY|nr:hypothetical protein PHLCEN_2v12857 [Hermanssonia centrifuga]
MSRTSTSTHIPATGKPRMVDDLISVILECNDHWWPRDYQRLALVSSAWLGPIRRRLYACPSLRTFHACNLFVRTVANNPCILSLVQGVDLRPMIPFRDRYALTEKDMTSLRFILNLAGLQSLTLGGELAVQAERFIHMMTNARSITSLHIDGSYIQCNDTLDCRHPASLEWNETIAFRFTKLRSLRLTNLQLAISDPPLPYSLRIADIALNDVTVSVGSVHHLCHESWGSVRTLSVTSKNAQESDELVRDLMECCENLEVLHYEVCCAGAHGEIFEEDIPLSRLRNLCLYDIDISPQTLVVLSQTCKALEHLSVLGRTVRLAATDWAGFVRSGALPSLQVLRTSMGTNSPLSGFTPWTTTMMTPVSDSCVARGITLSACE